MSESAGLIVVIPHAEDTLFALIGFDSGASCMAYLKYKEIKRRDSDEVFSSYGGFVNGVSSTKGKFGERHYWMQLMPNSNTQSNAAWNIKLTAVEGEDELVFDEEPTYSGVLYPVFDDEDLPVYRGKLFNYEPYKKEPVPETKKAKRTSNKLKTPF